MKYSDFAIDLLVERLIDKSMKDRTPKKYACDMFEAAEVIRQLRMQIASGRSAKSPPVKPTKDSLADRGCPVCNCYIHWDALNDSAKDIPRFCSHCGSEFDWSEEPKFMQMEDLYI